MSISAVVFGADRLAHDFASAKFEHFVSRPDHCRTYPRQDSIAIAEDVQRLADVPTDDRQLDKGTGRQVPPRRYSGTEHEVIRARGKLHRRADGLHLVGDPSLFYRERAIVFEGHEPIAHRPRRADEGERAHAFDGQRQEPESLCE
jgi:hypothetical protein